MFDACLAKSIFSIIVCIYFTSACQTGIDWNSTRTLPVKPNARRWFIYLHLLRLYSSQQIFFQSEQIYALIKGTKVLYLKILFNVSLYKLNYLDYSCFIMDLAPKLFLLYKAPQCSSLHCKALFVEKKKM